MKKSRFTLIELIVILGIISILTTILVSVLKQAHETSKEIECSESLRAIFLAQVSYSGDNQQWYVSAKDKTLGYSIRSKLDIQLGVRFERRYWCYNTDLRNYIDQEEIIPEEDILISGCPSMELTSEMTTSYSCNRFKTLSLTYGMRPARSTWDPSSNPIPSNSNAFAVRSSSSTDVAPPSDILFIADHQPKINNGKTEPSMYNWNNTVGAPWQSRHKNDTKNVLFFDGHINAHGMGAFLKGLYLDPNP